MCSGHPWVIFAGCSISAGFYVKSITSVSRCPSVDSFELGVVWLFDNGSLHIHWIQYTCALCSLRESLCGGDSGRGSCLDRLCLAFKLLLLKKLLGFCSFDDLLLFFWVLLK